MASLATTRAFLDFAKLTGREDRGHTVRFPRALIVTLALIFRVEPPGISSAENVWVRVPTGGSVFAIAADPQRRGRLYASSDDFMVSTDAGRHWIAHRWSPSGDVPTLLGVAPSEPTRIYAFSSWDGGSAGAAAILRSDDRGETWREYASFDTYNSAHFECLAIDPGDSDRLFVASDVGLYASDDGGESLDLVAEGSFQFVLIDSRDTKRVYAGGALGVLRSRDGGHNWERIDNGLPTSGDPLWVRRLAQDPFAPKIVYAATSLGLFKSSDAGESWTAVGLDLPRTDFVRILTTPWDRGVLYAATARGTIYRSGDRGEIWTVRSITGGTDGDGTWTPVTDLVIDPFDADTLYACIDGLGLFVTTDAGRNWWLKGESAATGWSVYRIFPQQRDTESFYALTVGWLIGTRNAERGWRLRTRGLPALVDDVFVAGPGGSALYAATWDGLYFSSDWGRSWTNVHPRPDGGEEQYAAAVDPADAMRVAVASDGVVFTTSDGGLSWQRRSTQFAKLDVGTLAFGPAGSNVLLIAVKDPDQYEYIVYRSVDLGATWLQVGGPVTDGWWSFSQLLTHPVDPEVIFAVAGGAVFQIRLGESKWRRFGPRIAPESFLFDPFDSNTLFLASSSKIFRSIDAGVTWSDMSTEWPGTPRRIRQFVVHPAQQGLFYVVSADGVFRLSQ